MADPDFLSGLLVAGVATDILHADAGNPFQHGEKLRKEGEMAANVLGWEPEGMEDAVDIGLLALHLPPAEWPEVEFAVEHLVGILDVPAHRLAVHNVLVEQGDIGQSLFD